MLQFNLVHAAFKITTLDLVSSDHKSADGAHDAHTDTYDIEVVKPVQLREQRLQHLSDWRPDRHDYIMLADGTGLITDEGRRIFYHFGIDLEETTRSKRPLCRTCRDRSERRPHLAGHLCATLLNLTLDLGWIKRIPENRALSITRASEVSFRSSFGLLSEW